MKKIKSFAFQFFYTENPKTSSKCPWELNPLKSLDFIVKGLSSAGSCSA